MENMCAGAPFSFDRPLSASVQLRPLDETVQTFFDKYDLDMSGSMNSHTEIRQLTTNLLATALKIREFKVRARCCTKFSIKSESLRAR